MFVVSLSLSAVAKLIFALQESVILSQSDPVFSFLTFRVVLFAAATFELVAVAAVAYSRDTLLHYLIMVMALTTILFYRIGYERQNPGEPCPCLGNLPHIAGVAVTKVNAATGALLYGLLIATLCGLLFQLHKGSAGSDSEYKPRNAAPR